MPYLLEFVLFLLPFAGYALWRRLVPGAEPRPSTVLLALLGVGLGLAGAVWYGRSVSLEAGRPYVPARLGADGRVVPGRPDPVGATLRPAAPAELR